VGVSVKVGIFVSVVVVVHPQRNTKEIRVANTMEMGRCRGFMVRNFIYGKLLSMITFSKWVYLY
jgi:hypothetical protein